MQKPAAADHREPAGKDSVAYLFNYSEALQQAWRDCGTGKSYAKDIFVKDSGKPFDPVFARWPDGFEHSLETLRLRCGRRFSIAPTPHNFVF